MINTSTPAQSCCCLLVVTFYLLFSLQIKAQVPSSIARKWRIGEQTVTLHEDFKLLVEAQVVKMNLLYIQENLEPIQNILEWVQTYIHNHDDYSAMPPEYAYLAIIDNVLVKRELSEQRIQWEANEAFWGLSDFRVKLLNLHTKLNKSEFIDDKRNLRLTTELLLETLSMRQKYFENWTLTMCILDWGYEASMDKVQNHYKKNRNAYANKLDFTLNLDSQILVEYFALRHVLEHLLNQQKNEGRAPATHIVCEDKIPKRTLKKNAKAFKVSEEALKLYNPWALDNKFEMYAIRYWLIPVKRSHAYKYPELPKIEIKIKPEIAITAPAEVENTTTEISYFHVVQLGENLIAIARKNNISVEELRRLNPAYLHTDLVHPQVKLLIKVRSDLEKNTFHRNQSQKPYTQQHGDEKIKTPKIPKTYQQQQIQQNHLQKRIEKTTKIENRGGNAHSYPRLSPTQTIKNRIQKKSKR